MGRGPPWLPGALSSADRTASAGWRRGHSDGEQAGDGAGPNRALSGTGRNGFPGPKGSKEALPLF